MMTEQRAIDLLKGILPKKVSFAQMICASNCYGDEMVYQEPEPYAIEFAINSIQENTKLKAEINRLNGKSEMYRDMADSFCNSNIKLKAEIEKLKSELERSVKLPCNVGDTVFIIGKCKDFPPKLDGTMWDSDGGYGTATGYYCPYEDSGLCPFKDLEDCSVAEDKFAVFEDVVCHICIEEDKMWYVCENSNGYETSDFSKTIFLTREEAERALKGGNYDSQIR